MASLPTHAKAVMIGGGVVGCSMLYHLAKMGWKDVVLLERSELTSGSSWHAAGVIHTINSDPNIARLQEYTIKLYREIEAISGQSCGIHRPGGIYLASTPERLDYLKQERAKARYMGLETEFISLEEAQALNPLIDPSKYLGALFEPRRRPCGSRRRHPCLCQGGPALWGDGPSPDTGAGDPRRWPMAAGRWSPPTARSRRRS